MADIPESTKLLPCPFCGGKPTAYEGRYTSSVKCDNGHAMHEYKPTLVEAIAAWNTRAAPPAMDREAVRLDRIGAVSERLLRRMRDVARQDGWALAVHGSMTRDLDVVAVPWTDAATVEPAFVEAMRAAVASELGGVAVIGAGEDGRTRGFKVKPNGRRCYTLHSTSEQLVEDENGAHPYVDLSILDFRLSAVGQAFGDGVYAACSALENTDRMADDLIASAWPDYADSYASLLPSTLSADAIRQGEGWQPISDADTSQERLTVLGYGTFRGRSHPQVVVLDWVKWIGSWSAYTMPFEPTHWMPLPDAPASHASDGGKA